MSIFNLPVSFRIRQQNSARIARRAVSNNQPPTDDLEQRHLIQEHLVLLLHAHKCQRRENQSNGKVGQCIPQCRIMKQVLRHMTSCSVRKSCPFTHCSSSRQIISHFKNCKRNDCPVCMPLKQASSRARQQQAVREQTAQNPQSRVQTRPLLQNNSTHAIANQPTRNYLLAVSVHPKAKMENVASINAPPTVLPCVKTTLLNIPSIVKDWHQSVIPDLRHDFIQKIIREIFTTTNVSALQGTKLIKALACAQKAAKIAECRMYYAANSKEEYYELFAEKIYRIQIALEKIQKIKLMILRERKRKELALQQQQVGGRNLTSMLGNNAAAAAPTPSSDNVVESSHNSQIFGDNTRLFLDQVD